MCINELRYKKVKKKNEIHLPRIQIRKLILTRQKIIKKIQNICNMYIFTCYFAIVKDFETICLFSYAKYAIWNLLAFFRWNSIIL